MIKHLTSLFICATSVVDMHAQQQKIVGQVVADDGSALPYVNVAVLSNADSSVVQSTVSDENGQFSVEVATQADALVLRFSLVGYETQWVAANDCRKVCLRAATTQLGEAVVKAPTQLFAVKDNQFVCQVANTILSRETTFQGVLAKLPGFYKSGGKAVAMKQGEVLYFVDDEPSTLEEVNRIAVHLIRSIDVNHHPQVEYGGEVGLVVNVHLRHRLEGVSATARSFTEVNHRWSQSTDAEVNWKIKSLNLTAGGEYTLQQSDRTDENVISSVATTQHREMGELMHYKDNRYRQAAVYGKLAYQLNDAHLLKLSYNFSPNKAEVLSEGALWQIDGNHSRRENYANALTQETKSHAGNAYYKGNFGERWTVEATFSWYKSHANDDRNITQAGETALFRVDADRQLWGNRLVGRYATEKLTWKLGGEWNYADLETRNSLTIQQRSSNASHVEEHRQVAFTTFGWNLTKWGLGLEAGLRYERLNRSFGDEAQPRQQLHFNSWVPSVMLSFMHGSWQHQLGYDVSVYYPSYHLLADGQQYTNRYAYNTSNAALSPIVEHRYNYVLSHDWLLFTALYNDLHHTIFYLPVLEKEGNNLMRRSSPVTFDRMRYVDLMLRVAPTFSWYNPNFTMRYYQSFVDIPGGVAAEWNTTLRKPQWLFQLSNVVTLPYDWTMSVDFTYAPTGSIGMTYVKSRGGVDLSVERSFFNEQLQVSLNAFDLFSTSTERVWIQYRGAQTYSRDFRDPRSVRLDLIWRFRKHNKQKDNSAIEAELRRL